MKIYKLSLLTIVSIFLPIFVLAQSIEPLATPGSFKDVICLITKLILDFIPYVVIIAVLAFLTGLIKYVANGDNEEKRGEGTKMMIYGIVGFFFMVSIWGMVKLFTESFKMPFGVPQLNQSEGSNTDFKSSCRWYLTGGD